MKKATLILSMFILMSLSPTVILAAGGPGGPGMGPKNGCWGVGMKTCIPIDGGITLLIAAGLAYGGRKTMQMRKK